MEIKILDSILHGNLKPWKLDTSDRKHLAGVVKAAISIKPLTNADLTMQLNTLVSDSPGLLQKLGKGDKSNFQDLPWQIDLPKYKDVATQFYWLLISADTLRIYNSILELSKTWTEPIDISYQVKKILTNVKVLTQQVSEELNEREMSTIPDDQSDLVHYALYYLKHSLIKLFFSIQDDFKEHLEQIITLEDFYLIDLQEPLANKVDLIYIGITKQSNNMDNSKIKKERVSFNFHGNPDKLKSVINSLCAKIELLKEELSPADLLTQLLLSKNIMPGKVMIYLDCDNKVFRYIIDNLSAYFSNLSLTNIELSQSIKSSTGKLLLANDLSKARTKNPKSKEAIDKILNQMK